MLRSSGSRRVALAMLGYRVASNIDGIAPPGCLGNVNGRRMGVVAGMRELSGSAPTAVLGRLSLLARMLAPVSQQARLASPTTRW